MSRSAKITRFFGDADHDFALRIGEAEELQEKFDEGLMLTMARCANVDVVAIRSVLRVGLVGGGMEREPAARLVARHLLPGDLLTCAQIAADVIEAALRGAKDETLGEQQGETATATISPEESSGSLASTEPAESLGSAPEKSESFPSGSSARPSPAGPKRTAAKKTRG